MSAIGKTFSVSLDMKQPTAQRNEWEVVEGDNGNVIEITLTDDGSPVDLSSCKVLAVFGLPTGQTVEQDTEDAYVILADYGIAVTGTPDENDTVTITVTGGACSASISGTGISAATVDGDVFIAKFPEDGTYVFKYVTAWQYGDNSVTIGGTDHNVITIALKTGSFSPGKSASGLMKCEIQVYSGVPQNTLVTSAQFTFRCRRAIMNDETIAATDDYPVLVELIHEVQQLQIANQSDWNEADPTDPAYIKNKPTLPGDATLSNKGIVQLDDSYTSVSQTKAATPNAVRQAYEKASVVAVDLLSLNTLPMTMSYGLLTGDMRLIGYEIGNPAVQLSKWDVTPGNGTLTVDGKIGGETSLRLYFAEVRAER